MNDDYDPRTCITAGELREAGATLPEHIPDCAWVPRSAMRYSPGEATGDPSTGCFSIRLEVTFTEGFRWIEAKVEITNANA